jgi:demethylmenaquinone methyltransferase/2-methoxy-6-polyprenyl-1,4-benzoquinol methylase
MVREIFSTVHDRYDFLNRVLSFRRDIAWRRAACRALDFPEGKGILLDLATGTGDIALEAARRFGAIRVLGIDLVPAMLVSARRKALDSPDGGRIAFCVGDAISLPLPDASVAGVTMAFGIRNVSDRMAALREMCRVTAPGGRVVILEMSAPRNALARWFHAWYLRRVIPSLAALFSQNREAYVYLGDSIIGFPRPDEFAGMMRAAGLAEVAVRPLTFGATWLFVGRKGGLEEDRAAG